MEQLTNAIKILRESWTKIDPETMKSVMSELKKVQLQSKDLKELYRDPDFGFVITAYRETKDTYRIPHNHGRGWVIYTVLEGIMEMGSYGFIDKLFLRNIEMLDAGKSTLYFPGDIHDTRCLSSESLILRLTSCDLKVEEKEGRMVRYDY